MKKSVMILFAVVAIFSLAQVAGADTVTFLGGPYEFGNGGEFTFKVTGSSLEAMVNTSYVSGTTSNVVTTSGSTPNFQTFCIETNQFISSGVYNATLDPLINSQGNPIVLGTAYLYQEFALGTLGTDLAAHFAGSTYDYSGTAAQRQASAGDLQNAIWALEGEGGSLAPAYTALLGFKFGSVPNAKVAVGAGGAFGVQALILTTATGEPVQDQLILTPGTTVTTPEPGSMLLLGFGLLGLFGVARRRVK